MMMKIGIKKMFFWNWGREREIEIRPTPCTLKIMFFSLNILSIKIPFLRVVPILLLGSRIIIRAYNCCHFFIFCAGGLFTLHKQYEVLKPLLSAATYTDTRTHQSTELLRAIFLFLTYSTTSHLVNCS